MRLTCFLRPHPLPRVPPGDAGGDRAKLTRRMGNPPKGKASVKSAGSTPSPEQKKPTARESHRQDPRAHAQSSSPRQTDRSVNRRPSPPRLSFPVAPDAHRAMLTHAPSRTRSRPQEDPHRAHRGRAQPTGNEAPLFDLRRRFQNEKKNASEGRSTSGVPPKLFRPPARPPRREMNRHRPNSPAPR